MPWKSWLLHDRILRIYYNGLLSSQDSCVEKSWKNQIHTANNQVELDTSQVKWSQTRKKNTQYAMSTHEKSKSRIYRPVGCIPCHLLSTLFCAFIHEFTNLKCQHYGGKFKMLINACFHSLKDAAYHFCSKHFQMHHTQSLISQALQTSKTHPSTAPQATLVARAENGAARFRWRAWCLLHKANP